MMNIKLFIHQIFHLAWIIASKCDRAQIVAQEFHRMVLFMEMGKVIKQFTVVGIFRVTFRANMPLVFAILKMAYKTHNNSTKFALLWGDPPSISLRALGVLNNTFFGVPIMKAPTAAPKIMTSSNGCHKTARCPPLAVYSHQKHKRKQRQSR